ncbi:uncharacterized protein LOC130680558 [Manis pentadactyla]|uniref:uncharacterized protein LOC130680558 n=1 Tax=Manis pentadactyla TaxID=143292 RepID=UPI00255C4B9E|nr:uncharacterized protein LOC130680558 [Manis pentadactyla]
MTPSSLAVNKPLLHKDVVGRGNNAGDCPTALPGEEEDSGTKRGNGRTALILLLGESEDPVNCAHSALHVKAPDYCQLWVLILRRICRRACCPRPAGARSGAGAEAQARPAPGGHALSRWFFACLRPRTPRHRHAPLPGAHGLPSPEQLIYERLSWSQKSLDSKNLKDWFGPFIILIRNSPRGDVIRPKSCSFLELETNRKTSVVVFSPPFPGYLRALVSAVKRRQGAAEGDDWRRYYSDLVTASGRRIFS